MAISCIEFYTFVPVPMTLVECQGHSGVGGVILKITSFFGHVLHLLRLLHTVGILVLNPRTKSLINMMLFYKFMLCLMK